MSEPSKTGTVRFQRVIRSTPERLYRAWTDPRAFVKWLPPHGFYAEVHKMDAVVGGEWRMSFLNMGSGNAHSFGGKYLELVPGEKIRYTARFDDPNLPGEMTTTVVLTKIFCGTEVNIVQDGIPAVIPEQACIMGWQESLQLLMLMVEADVPG